MQGKAKKKGLFLVKVWHNEQDFTAMAQLAEKLGFRRVALPIRTQKPHGMADEWRANTDGISQTYKALREYYDKTEAWRLARAAELARGKQELAAKEQDITFAGLFSVPEQKKAKKENPAEGGGVA